MQAFRRLAVIGAGNMGSGIAQKMATEGFDVVLVDLDEDKVARGIDTIRDVVAQGVERRIFRPEQAEGLLARIRGTADWSELGDVDLAVEAVYEDQKTKRDVFARLDDVCRRDALLATNTSSLSVTELAAATRHPERVLGLHYFYHPAKNRLVEAVPGERTDPEQLQRAWGLQEQLGKTAIRCKDRPGFIVNRYFVPWLNEAVRLLEEKVADVATIEEACQKTFHVGMGPFELMNVTGVPIALHAASTLGRALGSFYHPTALLRRQVESGENWTLGGEPDPAKSDEVADRMRAVVFYVACALVDEEVGTIEDTDIGARVGLRWPKGPFEMINRYGVARAADLVQKLADRWELRMPEVLAEQAQANRSFKFLVVRSEVHGGVATLTVNRPDAMNALNEALVSQLHTAFKRAVEDDSVQGIVIAGAGKAFMAGADIRFFVRNIDSGDLDRIVNFTRAGHDLLDDIDRCPKPVVARMHGMALGGGLELALACDRIVASTKAAMAFPETGIGIYPGLGGTQRTTRRVGPGLAKWLVFSGQMIGAQEAASIGLIDRAVPHEDLDDAVAAALAEGPVERREPAETPPTHRSLAEFFAAHDAEALLAGRAEPAAEDPRVARSIAMVARKAPIALRIAGELIEEGASRPLEQGLKMELDHLVEIFGSRDAYEGLSTLGKKKPEFEGR